MICRWKTVFFILLIFAQCSSHLNSFRFKLLNESRGMVVNLKSVNQNGQYISEQQLTALPIEEHVNCRHTNWNPFSVGF